MKQRTFIPQNKTLSLLGIRHLIIVFFLYYLVTSISLNRELFESGSVWLHSKKLFSSRGLNFSSIKKKLIL